MLRRLIPFALVGTCTVLGPSAALGDCPPAGTILVHLEGLELTAAARTREFELPPPEALYKKAASRPGKVVVKNDGKLGQAVLVTDLPVGALWMGVNDEDHYAEGGYVPVLHSEVVGGTPRGQDRLLFQYFKRAGVGRWWLDKVVMSHGLFEESRGQLWELRWWDLMDSAAEQSLPGEVSAELAKLRLSPIRASRGAWLLIPVTAECTLIEYVTYSDPGGFLSVAQILGAGRVIRDTLEGIEKLAREHIPLPHEGARFVRPDGTPIMASED